MSETDLFKMRQKLGAAEGAMLRRKQRLISQFGRRGTDLKDDDCMAQTELLAIDDALHSLGVLRMELKHEPRRR